MKIKDRYVKICPKCGSINVERKLTAWVIAYGAPQPFKCNTCSHEGHIFPEVKTENIIKFQREMQKQR